MCVSVRISGVWYIKGHYFFTDVSKWYSDHPVGSLRHWLGVCKCVSLRGMILIISLMRYYSFLYKMSWVKFWWILMQWSSEQLSISLRWYLQLVYIFSCQSLAFPWHQNILNVILYMLIFWNGVYITLSWSKVTIRISDWL